MMRNKYPVNLTPEEAVHIVVALGSMSSSLFRTKLEEIIKEKEGCRIGGLGNSSTAIEMNVLKQVLDAAHHDTDPSKLLVYENYQKFLTIAKQLTTRDMGWKD